MLKNLKLNSVNLVIILTLCFSPGMLLADGAFKEEVLSRLQAQGGKGNPQIGEHVLYGSKFMANLYQVNGYERVWDDDSIAVLKEEIYNLKDDGLNSADYWFASIDTLIHQQQQGDLDASSAVELDMLLSEAFIRAYYNLLVGKADPERLDENFNFSKPLQADKLRPELIAQLEKGRVAEAFAQARPETERYSRLKDALTLYRGYQAAGSWPEVQEGKTLKPGDRGVRVAQVRARLAVTGDYTANNGAPELYDSSLEDAVKHFQDRHGLEADAAVGAQTIATMNVPVEQRIDQLRVNLERQRWYDQEAHGEFMIADIAGYYVHWIKDGQVHFREDIYKRDAKVLKALDAQFKVRAQDVAGR